MCKLTLNYLRRHLASGEGIVMLDVCVCVCVGQARRATTPRRISLGGKGNVLYPVLSSVSYAAVCAGGRVTPEKNCQFSDRK